MHHIPKTTTTKFNLINKYHHSSWNSCNEHHSFLSVHQSSHPHWYGFQIPITLSFYLISHLMCHCLCMVQHCMHIAEKQQRKPSPHTPINFGGLPQYAPHLARHDGIGLYLMLQEYPAQYPAK